MKRVVADYKIWISPLIWGGKPLQLVELAQMLRAARVVTPTERRDVVQSDPEHNRVLECAVAARQRR